MLGRAAQFGLGLCIFVHSDAGRQANTRMRARQSHFAATTHHHHYIIISHSRSPPLKGLQKMSVVPRPLERSNGLRGCALARDPLKRTYHNALKRNRGRSKSMDPIL